MEEERKKGTKERKDKKTFSTLELSMRDRCLHRISSISLSAIESKQKKKKGLEQPIVAPSSHQHRIVRHPRNASQHKQKSSATNHTNGLI